MTQPQMVRTTCSQCNAWYNSDRELRDHMRTAHRWVVSEQSLPLSSGQRDRQGGTTPLLTEQETKRTSVVDELRRTQEGDNPA